MLLKKQIKWYKLFETVEAAENYIATDNVKPLYFQNKKLCLARTADGLFAIDDKCPHNGASLSKGRCTPDGAVVCPVHRYHFDLKTGRSKSGLGSYVQTYPLQYNNDGVYIGIEKIVWNLF